ncbi:MAG: AbrB/MazE/SpoVT family DNA-binding domain-containing protein [Terracidiphilus sp.]
MSAQQPTIEYLTTAKIGEKGQITVPKPFRDDLDLKSGAPLAVLRMGDGLILFPEQRRFDLLCERIGAALTAAGATPEMVLASLPEARRRVYERRYGKSGSATSGPSRRLPKRGAK